MFPFCFRAALSARRPWGKVVKLTRVKKVGTLIVDIAGRASVAMQSRGGAWGKYVDFILAPLFIFFSLYSPYFGSGSIFALDEGYHLSCINDLLRGSVLYTDIYMQHGPLLEYIPYWLMKLFGVHIAVLMQESPLSDKLLSINAQ